VKNVNILIPSANGGQMTLNALLSFKHFEKRLNIFPYVIEREGYQTSGILRGSSLLHIKLT